MAHASPHSPAAHAAEGGAHVHGTMDIRDQERTFHGFLRLSTWAAGIVILVLIFLALVNL